MRKVHGMNGTDLSTTSAGIWLGEFSHQQQSGSPTGADTHSMGVARKLFIAAIDGSPTLRTIMEMCLDREGYAVKSFSDGVEALRWFLQPGAPIPALILLDRELPQMNGYDVVRTFKARSQFNQTVIVMFIPHDGVINRPKGRLVGVNDFITKPFTTQDIAAVVASCLDIPA